MAVAGAGLVAGHRVIAARMTVSSWVAMTSSGVMSRLARHIATLPSTAATTSVARRDAAWPKPLRRQVIERVLAAMSEACGMDVPSPGWWVTFRVVDDGSWGSRGTVLSILDLLGSGVFTPPRAEEIRAVRRADA